MIFDKSHFNYHLVKGITSLSAVNIKLRRLIYHWIKPHREQQVIGQQRDKTQQDRVLDKCRHL